jgi:hypothetical protein
VSRFLGRMHSFKKRFDLSLLFSTKAQLFTHVFHHACVVLAAPCVSDFSILKGMPERERCHANNQDGNAGSSK